MERNTWHRFEIDRNNFPQRSIRHGRGAGWLLSHREETFFLRYYYAPRNAVDDIKDLGKVPLRRTGELAERLKYVIRGTRDFH